MTRLLGAEHVEAATKAMVAATGGLANQTESLRDAVKETNTHQSTSKVGKPRLGNSHELIYSPHILIFSTASLAKLLW